MRQYPLNRNERLSLPDQPISLEWFVCDPDDINGKGGNSFYCRARCSVCDLPATSWVTLGWPDCEADELDCLDCLRDDGKCEHTGVMREYLTLLLLETPTA